MEDRNSDAVAKKKPEVLMEIKWKNVVFFTFMYLGAVYGLYRSFTSAMGKTILYSIFLGTMAGLGVTAGAHRLWSHRSYKAKLPLRIFLAFLNTIAFEKDIYDFSRDHRAHHKFSETDADPHNPKRGLFFSHVGWLLVKKHPEVLEKGKTIDLSDVLADPVVRFQRKYYTPLVILLCFVLPTAIPMMFWEENFKNSFFIATILRYMTTVNSTLLINSVAHRWGNRPYDRYIKPADNIWMFFGTMGEGFHNYHHTFPWDYSSSEFGLRYNLTTAFIDLMAWLGLAYDRKTASPELIRDRKLRTGELSMHLDSTDMKVTHPHSE